VHKYSPLLFPNQLCCIHCNRCSDGFEGEVDDMDRDDYRRLGLRATSQSSCVDEAPLREIEVLFAILCFVKGEHISCKPIKNVSKISEINHECTY